MSNRIEATKNGAVAAVPEKNGHAEGQPQTPAAEKSGGIGQWLPLILNVVLMPLIAVGMTQFYLLPRINKGSPGTESQAKTEHGAEHSKHGEKGSGSSAKVTMPLGGKILVNVAGTLGTRYLISNMTLVGTSGELKGLVEEHDPQLRDAAAGILAAKTINDLEKPGIRNLLRTELISVFNDILGKTLVNDIYLTEFAIQ
jgi:flagellar protein FliL